MILLSPLTPLTLSQTSRSDPVAAIRRHVGHSADGAGWLGAPELPGVAEILCGVQGVGGLAPNIVDGPWPSRTEYLETHYEILRREGLEGLRLSVQCYRDNANMSDTKDTCVYTNVSRTRARQRFRPSKMLTAARSASAAT